VLPLFVTFTIDNKSVSHWARPSGAAFIANLI
jgi:hypothetical protein